MADRKIIRVGIIGAGDGAGALLAILKDDKEAQLVALACRSEDRASVELAKSMGLRIYTDYRQMAESKDLDLVIDASGSAEVEDYLKNRKQSHSSVLTSFGAWFLWKMVEEYKERQSAMRQVVAEQEMLYSSGVMLASAADTEQTLNLIMESALSLTNMEAGTLALYEEERSEMTLKVSLGFRPGQLPDQFKWTVRPGGLTGHILSNEKPTVIENLEEYDRFDATPLLALGVRSLIAAPLKVENRIVGVLYVDNFAPRTFTEREINILGLLATQAAAAIDKALLLERAELQAVTDELTKLSNHRQFIRALDQEMCRAERYSFPLTLLMLDIDYFKNFNDSNGHQQGNQTLALFADILRRNARENDIAARYGGEEFALVLVETGAEAGAIVAERIRREVEETPFEGGATQPLGKVTVSIGLALFDGSEQITTAQLVERADVALYRAKNGGRNQVVTFTQEV